MRKLFILLFLSTTLFSGALAQNFPEPMSPPRLVNDFANALSDAEEQQLERKLVAFDDSTSTQIAVVFIQSLEGYEISMYGAQLAEKWGIGQKETRNGVLLLSALDERKVTIQVGYGLEPVITDALSRLIIENDIVPNYRAGNYFQGVNQATSNLMQLAIGEFPATLKEAQKKRDGGGSGWIVFAIIGGVFFMGFISRIRRANQIGSGGAAGPIIFWDTPGRHHGGYWDDFGSGGGGFGGGGFGGFGGGGFGGGGASGGW